MPELLIPFPGLYNSWVSQMLDFAETQAIEYECERENGENGEPAEWPEPLRLADVGDEWFRAMDYVAAHESLAKDYLEHFDAWAGDALRETRPCWRYSWALKRRVRSRAPGCGFRWSLMTSPRYYTFETDRIFATCSWAFIDRLWARSKAEDHATLRAIIRDRFTSYDGFLSHYANDLDRWPTSRRDWDHNQLNALLLAVLRIECADDGEFRGQFEEDYESGDRAVNAGMDRQNLRGLLMNRRISQLESWAEDDPEAVARFAVNNPELWAQLRDADESAVAALDIPLDEAVGFFYRCPETPDLFECA